MRRKKDTMSEILALPVDMLSAIEGRAISLTTVDGLKVVVRSSLSRDDVALDKGPIITAEPHVLRNVGLGHRVEVVDQHGHVYTLRRTRIEELRAQVEQANERLDAWGVPKPDSSDAELERLVRGL